MSIGGGKVYIKVIGNIHENPIDWEGIKKAVVIANRKSSEDMKKVLGHPIETKNRNKIGEIVKNADRAHKLAGKDGDVYEAYLWNEIEKTLDQKDAEWEEVLDRCEKAMKRLKFTKEREYALQFPMDAGRDEAIRAFRAVRTFHKEPNR